MCGMQQLTLEACRVDLNRGIVHRDGERISLTDMERELLRYLADGHVASRADLLRDVWGYAPTVRSRAVENTVWRLRKKIERNADQAEHLLTVRGVGFRLLLPTLELAELIGRDGLLGELGVALSHRWVTLTGPPGVGKTALAHAVAGGAWWVDARGDVLAQVAASLEVRLEETSAVLQVARALVGREIELLVLDGVTRRASQVVGAWLDAAPRLRVLATSSRPFGAPREHVLHVPPLDVAPGGTAVDLLQRQIRRAGAETDASDEAWLHDIATSLDGLPLALCLAARRVPLLGVRGLAERLHGGLGAADVQGGLTQVLDAVWVDLDGPAAEVLRVACHFSGLFELADLAAVCDRVVDDEAQLLREAGLLQPERGALRVLATVRQHVRQTMTSEVTADVRRRHAQALAELGSSEFLESSEFEGHGVARLGRLIEDLRLAFDEHAGSALARPLGRALCLVARLFGPLSLGLHAIEGADLPLERLMLLRMSGQIDAALALPLQDTPRAAVERAAALAAAGRLAEAEAELDLEAVPGTVDHVLMRVLAGDLAATGGRLNEAARLWEQAQRTAPTRLRPGIARRLGEAWTGLGDPLRASDALNQAVHYAVEQDDTGAYIRIQLALGNLAMARGKMDEAQVAIEEGLRRARSVGAVHAEVMLSANLSVVLLELDDAVAAERALAGGCAVAEWSAPDRLGELLGLRAVVLAQIGEGDLALAALSRAEPLLRRGRPFEVGRFLQRRLAVLSALDQPVDAAQAALDAWRVEAPPAAVRRLERESSGE